ncbi:MAG: DNA polymerase III subunit alpha [Candidatus Eiseniibacteriota bacterium]|nr:MAG: DNA polymerase III subunit alpha [Candidatus Eisenbacteria bacterium]
MNKGQKFVHLHLHTEYSLLEGMCRIGPLFDSVLAKGMQAVAMTDHMSFFGVVPFVKEAGARGVKPIIGCEMDVAGLHSGSLAGDGKPFRVVLLAENNDGYDNLLKLTTKALTRTDALRGSVDARDISSHRKGIIALSGSRHSEVSHVFSVEGPAAASRLVAAYEELFGRENWFLEICRHNVEEERELDHFLLDQFKTQGVPLVATNEVRYLERSDAETHDVLLAIHCATHLGDPDRERLAAPEYYLKSPEQMWERFGDVPSALERTVELSERCRVEIPLNRVHLPGFKLSPGHTVRSYLRVKCEEGLRERFTEEEMPAARERLDRELAVVAEKGLSGFFLVVWDLVRFARQKKIPVGPGRGSSVGSIIAYCLGISDVDPIKFDLVFERFLSRGRSGLPDIDVDLCHKCRERVVDYLTRKYGEKHVAHIATLDTLAPRSAVRDAGRALAVGEEVVDRVARAIPGGSAGSIEAAMRESVPLAKLYGNDERARALLDAAREIEGLPRHPSVHAGGLLITDAPLTDYVALQRLASGEVIAQITKDPVEELGLLKIDLLGLRFLTALYEAVSMVKARRDLKLDVGSIPLDDGSTYALMAEGKTLGVFQLESSGMQDLLRQLKPERLEDVVAVLSLYRPGPLGGGLVERYIARRHGREPVSYPHPMLESVLKETFGVILYQEQVMEVARVMAGFSLEEADEFRVVVTRRKPGDLASLRQRFVGGAVERGVEGEDAEEIFKLLLHFAGFGYNKSHSAAYALTTYRCAYMMVHFPMEYITALLNNNLGFTDRMRNYMAVARERNIGFAACDVNASEVDFKIEGEAIRVGLSVVKHVGEGVAREIVSERNAWGDFGSLTDFCFRTHGKLTRQAVENLVRAGAFDFTRLRRSQMLAVLGQILKVASGEGQPERSRGEEQTELGLAERGRKEECVDVPDLPELSQSHLREGEQEATDLFISQHPLHDREHLLRQMGIVTIEEALASQQAQVVSVAGLLAEYRKIRTKSSRPMAFLTLRDETGTIEVVIFPNVFERLARAAEETKGKPFSVKWARNEPLVVTGKIQREETTKLLCEAVEPLAEVQEEFYSIGVLEIRLPERFKNYSRLKNVLLSAPGNSEVRISWTQTGFTFAEDSLAEETRTEIEALRRHKVHVSEELVEEVEALVGKGNVGVATKDGVSTESSGG